MTNELTVIDLSTSQEIDPPRNIIRVAAALPRAANAMADEITRALPNFLPILPASTDPNQFQHALIIAANELDASKVSDPKSIVMCAYACCVMGLQPGKVLGLAYFVPFKGVVQLIPGYKGFIELAHRSGFVSSIHADVVYEGEQFEYWTDETGPKLLHRPSRKRDFSKPIEAYCISQLSDGGRQIRVLTPEELKKAEKGTDVWKNYSHEMRMKTAIRRASKLWKMTKELAIAVRLDEQAEEDGIQDISDFGGRKPAVPGAKPAANPDSPIVLTRDERRTAEQAAAQSTSAAPQAAKPPPSPAMQKLIAFKAEWIAWPKRRGGDSNQDLADWARIVCYCGEDGRPNDSMLEVKHWTDERYAMCRKAMTLATSLCPSECTKGRS